MDGSLTNAFVALISLTTLEVVLGIDNIVFLAVLTNKLDPAVREKARRIGLLLALAGRVILLLCIQAVVKLEEYKLLTIMDHEFSAKDMILIAGGLFLLVKATIEIHEQIEEAHATEEKIVNEAQAASFSSVIAQIVWIDLVFSLDSVITAVGLAKDNLWVMITAIVIAIITMMVFAGSIADFIHKHPTLKMLALSFLMLIGVFLIMEGFHTPINRQTIYFAMAFSVMVELLNLQIRGRKLTDGPKVQKMATPLPEQTPARIPDPITSES